MKIFQKLAAMMLALALVLTLVPETNASAYSLGHPSTDFEVEGDMKVKDLKVTKNQLVRIECSDGWQCLYYDITIENNTKGDVRFLDYHEGIDEEYTVIKKGKSGVITLISFVEGDKKVCGVKLTSKQYKAAKSEKGLKVTAKMRKAWKAKKKSFPTQYMTGEDGGVNAQCSISGEYWDTSMMWDLLAINGTKQPIFVDTSYRWLDYEG